MCARKHVRPLLCAAGVRDDLVKIPSVLKRCPLLLIPIVPDDSLLLQRDGGGWPAGRRILRDFPIYVFRVRTPRTCGGIIDHLSGPKNIRSRHYIFTKDANGTHRNDVQRSKSEKSKNNVCISIGLERYELINGYWTNGESMYTHCNASLVYCVAHVNETKWRNQNNTRPALVGFIVNFTHENAPVNNDLERVCVCVYVCYRMAYTDSIQRLKVQNDLLRNISLTTTSGHLID